MKENPANMEPIHQINPPPLPLETKETHHQSAHTSLGVELMQSLSSKSYHHQETDQANNNDIECMGRKNNTHHQPINGDVQEIVKGVATSMNVNDDSSGRERLKRHRIEVAGSVWIPDIWGQEDLLKDWIDCSVFDASLVPSRIMSARSALVEEGRRVTTRRLRIENRC